MYEILKLSRSGHVYNIDAVRQTPIPAWTDFTASLQYMRIKK